MTDTEPEPAGPPRFAVIAACVAVLLLLGGAGLFVLALRDSGRGIAGTALSAAIGGPFRLVDQNGRTVTDADLKGKWQLIFFGYTHCPDVCPTTLNDLSLALDRLGAKKSQVGIVFITVDPERDTEAAMKSYVASFDAPILALTGSPEAVAQAAKDYRVYYARHPRADGGYDMDHSAVIYVMDPEGRFTATFTPDTSDADIAARLAKLVS